MAWFSDKIDELTGKLTKPLEDSVSKFTDSLADGPIGKFFELIGSYISSWTDGITSWVGEKWDWLGKWIDQTFLSDVELESDKVLENVKATEINQSVRPKGYKGDYDKVVEDTIQTATAGWGRVIEYSGMKAGQLGSWIGSSLGMSPEDIENGTVNEGTIKAVAERTAKQVYDAVYREALMKEIGFSEAEMSAQEVGPITLKFLEDNPAAHRAASRIAATISGIEVNDDGDIIPAGDANQRTGIYGQIINGGGVDKFVLPTLPDSNEVFGDAIARLQIQKTERNNLTRFLDEYNSWPEEFRNALTPEQVKNYLSARFTKDADGNLRISDEDAKFFRESNLSVLAGQLKGDNETNIDRAFSQPFVDLDFDIGTRKLTVTGSDGTDITTGSMVLPAAANQPSTTPAR